MALAREVAFYGFDNPDSPYVQCRELYGGVLRDPNSYICEGDVELDLSLLLRIAALARDVLDATGATHVPSCALVKYKRVPLARELLPPETLAALYGPGKARGSHALIAAIAHLRSKNFFSSFCEPKMCSTPERILRDKLIKVNEVLDPLGAYASPSVLLPREANDFIAGALVLYVNLYRELPAAGRTTQAHVVRAGVCLFMYAFKVGFSDWSRGYQLMCSYDNADPYAFRYQRGEFHPALDTNEYWCEALGIKGTEAELQATHVDELLRFYRMQPLEECLRELGMYCRHDFYLFDDGGRSPKREDFDMFMHMLPRPLPVSDDHQPPTIYHFDPPLQDDGGADTAAMVDLEWLDDLLREQVMDSGNAYKNEP